MADVQADQRSRSQESTRGSTMPTPHTQTQRNRQGSTGDTREVGNNEIKDRTGATSHYLRNEDFTQWGNQEGAWRDGNEVLTGALKK